MGGRRVVAGAATALLLAACTGTAAEPEVATATVQVATPSPASPTPTPTPEDPYAVPDEIDEAYLNRVFEALEKVIGDATRLIVAQKTYPPEADDLLQSVYSPAALQIVRDGWMDTLLIDRELSRYADPPGDRETVVESILEVAGECVFVRTSREFRGVIAEDVPRETVYVALVRASGGPDNPTPWIIGRQAQLPDGVNEPESSLCAEP